MPLYFLHRHTEFNELLRAVEHEKKVHRSLVEKDYWIMHCLFGLKQEGFGKRGQSPSTFNNNKK